MSEQPDSVLDEAVRLMEGLRRKVVRGAIRGAVAGPRDTDDVWSQATREDPFDHLATGSAECRVCPVCRAIAAARTSAPDVVDYMMDAGESLMAAAREAKSAYERSRRAGGPADDAGGATGSKVSGGGGRVSDEGPRGGGARGSEDAGGWAAAVDIG